MNRLLLIFITILCVSLSGCFTDSNYVSGSIYYHQPIMSHGSATAREMSELLLKSNPKLKKNAIKVAQIYIEESNAEGVNYDVAFCQMCLETNYLRFGGQVKITQNNFCGLGALDGGAKGASFPTVRHGVRAHIQHLKAYASKQPLRNRCIDPRFKLVKRGAAPTIYNLTRRWASDPRYHQKIASLIARLHNI